MDRIRKYQSHLRNRIDPIEIVLNMFRDRLTQFTFRTRYTCNGKMNCKNENQIIAEYLPGKPGVPGGPGRPGYLKRSTFFLLRRKFVHANVQ